MSPSAATLRGRARRARSGGRRGRSCWLAAALLACAAGWSTLPSHAIAAWPFAEGDDARELGARAASLLSGAIQLRSVNPPGDEQVLAHYFAEYLEGAGIETRTIETPTPAGAQGRAAVWGRLPGNGSARPLILLSHLDVVPADASEWDRDPFAGEVEGGFVYGRGALDAKGVSVIQILALSELAKRRRPLERDVILLATPDEESGGRDGAGYIVREHADLLGGAEYLLTEGGSIRPGRSAAVGSPASPAVWGVTVTEKSPCWLELSTRGTPGHGSTPQRDAAVHRLVAALDRIRRIESPVRVLAEVEEMFLAQAPTAASENRAGFIALAAALEGDSSFRRRFLANPNFNALVRNTISITLLASGAHTNVVPTSATARIDARLLPGERCEDFVQAIRAVITDPEVGVETLLSFPSRSSPSGSELFRAIERVASRVEPDALVVPRMIAGFTDAHWFREQGIIAYGFVPRRLTAADTRGIHGTSERVSIDNLRGATATLIAIIEELAGSGETER